MVTLINSANITNVNAFNRSGKLRLTEELGNGLTIAGTGTILTVLGLTAQTYTKTADTALDVDTNVNIDGTLVVDGATTIGGATTINSTLNVTGLTTVNNLTSTGKITTGDFDYTADTWVQVGVDNANTTAIGIRADKGTGTRCILDLEQDN